MRKKKQLVVHGWVTRLVNEGRRKCPLNSVIAGVNIQLSFQHLCSQSQHIHSFSLNSMGRVKLVFDVQLSIWCLRSCSTDGVKNALLISHFIKFNPLVFQKKINKK